MSDIIFKAGEATVLAAPGQFTDAMPEVLIGSVKGPVGHALASMLGQAAGHTRFFAVRDLNQMARPVTLMTTKVTIASAEYVELFGGVVQAAIADAVVDSVSGGVIAKELVDEICIIVTVWLDPRCAGHAELDKKDLYNTNYNAMRMAIARALKGEPTIDELIQNRKSIKHYALDGVIDY